MFGAVAAAALCWGCGSAASSLPERVAVPFETVCPQADGTPVFIGGYGSAMGYDAADSCFWLLTDRGPNVDGPTPESKVFALPEFAPRVGKFRLSGDSLEAVGTVPLRDAAGNLFSGLPAAGGDGSTGEVGYDLAGEAVCDSLRRGLDTEGLALAGDGTFWVSDEYGPYLLRFDGEGRLLEEYSPFNGGLPEVLARRRPNRGMEGLAYDAGADMLFGIMQSPLYNPDASTKDTAVFCRIVALRPTDGRTAQYLYPLEDPGNVGANSARSAAEICSCWSAMRSFLQRGAVSRRFSVLTSRRLPISLRWTDTWPSIPLRPAGWPGMASGPWRRSFFATSSPQRPVIPTTSRRGCASSETEPFA